MKKEYDLKNAVRGKFYKPNTVLAPPIHLDPDVLAWLLARAQERDTTLDGLVNELLRREIQIVQAAE